MTNMGLYMKILFPFPFVSMKTQLRMEAFYSFSERFAKIRSKRIKKAVKGIGGGLSSEVVDHTLQEGPGIGNKKRLSPDESEDKTSEKDLSKTDEKATNKRKRSEKPSSSRGRGSAQKRGRGRGRGRKNLLPELSDGSSDGEGDDNDNVVGLQAPNEAKPGNPQKVRRVSLYIVFVLCILIDFVVCLTLLIVCFQSTRSRNPVKYSEKEDDQLDESRGNGESLSENLDDDDDDFLKNLGKLGNVSEERAQNEPTTMDASNNDCPSEDYIQMGGGGFCVDEAETGGDAHVEDKASDDYRVMGGGFCVDEDETGEEDDAMDEEVLETEDVNSQNKAKRQNEDPSLEEYGGGIEIGNSSAGGLSAMPFLKRKKRKN